MGYRHQREDLVAAACDLVLDEGLAALTFGRLAKRVGTSDRMIVYYFPTKADLVAATVTVLGGQLQAVLEDAFGPAPLPPRELVARAWPALASPASDRVFAITFELFGAASAGRSPYAELAPALLHAWVDWLAARVLADDPVAARAAAWGVIAQVDGLLLVRQVAGAEAADAAAAALGITGG